MIGYLKSVDNCEGNIIKCNVEVLRPEKVTRLVILSKLFDCDRVGKD